MTSKLVGDGPILIVDDDQIELALLQRFFDGSSLAVSHKLHLVRSGQEMIDYMDSVAISESPMPSIILLDINMPHMNGFQALKIVRSMPQFRYIPAVLFVSNSDDPNDVGRAKELGADFIQKFDNAAEANAFFDGLAPQLQLP